MEYFWLNVIADLVLISHVGFILFIVLSLFLIIMGGNRGWQWVRNPWFRYLHLMSIIFVIIQTLLGQRCPLTIIEMQLQAQVGDFTYSGGFIAYWLKYLFFYSLPGEVFLLSYSVFGIAVLWVWRKIPPQAVRKN